VVGALAEVLVVLQARTMMDDVERPATGWGKEKEKI